MLIALDIDDVLADFCGQVAKWLGPPAVFPYSRLMEAWPKDDIIRLFRDEQFHQELIPIAGSVEGAWKLWDIANLLYVSSRPYAMRGITRTWLSDHDYPPVNAVCLDERKADFLRHGNFDWAIDDMEHFLKAAMTGGSSAILFSRMWNVNFSVGMRANDWSEVVESLTNSR